MSDAMQLLLTSFASLLCTFWIYPYVLRVAKSKNIVDNPDARKLQRTPVPVLGGLAVVFGILTGMMVYSLFDVTLDFYPMFSSIIIIFLIGMLDDTIALSPKTRFVVEIILVLYIIYLSGCQLNHFHGLWQLNVIPDYISIPLTVVASVGIINAINLIDGVDGYSSGYCIVSSGLFCAMFAHLGYYRMVAFSLIVCASLLPFFLCNVFGKRSKMFIGDAGTLSLGIIFSGFIMRLITFTPSSELAYDSNLALIPFSFSVLCVPVFDTLRVMSSRMFKGKSPFNPDKTHLHHLFIELGFSHIGTTISILILNLFVVFCWYVSSQLGASSDVQLYVVFALGILLTFVLYPLVKRHIRNNTSFYRLLSRIGSSTHVKQKAFWHAIQCSVDNAIGVEETEEPQE